MDSIVQPSVTNYKTGVYDSHTRRFFTPEQGSFLSAQINSGMTEVMPLFQS